MYRHATDALGLEPEQCLFVDDDPALVAAAIELGYAGLAVLRDPPKSAADKHSETGTISSLTGILDLF